MKILLVACNAKYIHSSLAIRSLATYVNKNAAYPVTCLEFTINQQEDKILEEIIKEKPDVIGFSCYIWNISMILRLIKNIKKILPHTWIIAGGPEVSYEPAALLEKQKDIDIVIMGEGEEPFRLLTEQFCSDLLDFSKIQGLAYRNGGKVVCQGVGQPVPLDEIPFVYENWEGMEHKILYYETQRGCPYQCQYCLSSVENGVRFLSQERIQRDLQFFLDRRVPQVKFVDRTFNCNKKHALGIWRYVMEHDNGITNFHMEITGDTLDEEILDCLSQARPGLFQFEIGVQSTNPDTLQAVKRNTAFEKLKPIVTRIKKWGNIHQHLDLIAGLPYENYASFRQSFHDVYSLKPEQFQLGFLKLLRGSGLRRDAEKYGIVYRDEAPYEVLFTDHMTYGDLCRLKGIEEIVELYYNSGKALETLNYAVKFYDSPFDFYEAFAAFRESKGYDKVQQGKMELYSVFLEFCISQKQLAPYVDMIRELLRFDIYLYDNIKTIPQEIRREETTEEKKKIRAFFQNAENIARYLPNLAGYAPNQLARMCHIEIFEKNVLSAGRQEENNQVAILFQYHTRSHMNHHGMYCPVELS